MQYWSEFTDSDGFVHSIDNVIIDYYLNCNFKTVTKALIALLSGFGFDPEHNSKLDVLPSFKYEYFVDHLWFDGFHFSLGKYVDYDKVSHTVHKLDMMRFKVNPNKHAYSPAFDALLGFLREYCADGYLVRYDYAIDVPVKIQDVLVVSSRKEKGLYKGTRYFGQRHTHGYLKIYDKAKEQSLEHDLTRIEYTVDGKKELRPDNIVVRGSPAAVDGLSGLSSQSRLYLDMLSDIKALGGEIEPYLERINYRTYKQIEPFLYSGKQLRVDQTILNSLVEKINDTFILADIEQKVNDKGVLVDADGFMICETDLPIPF